MTVECCYSTSCAFVSICFFVVQVESNLKSIDFNFSINSYTQQKLDAEIRTGTSRKRAWYGTKNCWARPILHYTVLH